MAQLYTDLDELEEESQEPREANLGAAALYLCEVFQHHGVSFAFIGGYSLLLRGSRRPTNDIDLAADSTMRALYNLALQCHRLIIPRSRLAATNVLRVFMRTGPEWDRQTRTEHLVEIDILVPGDGRGVPNPVSAASELIRSQNPLLGTSTHLLPVLMIPFQLRAKLRAYRHREGDNDMEDIRFILENYEAAVNRASTHAVLNEEDCIFFLEHCPRNRADQYAAILGIFRR